MNDVVRKFYEQVDNDDALADKLDQLSIGEFNIEKILCATVELAKEYGYEFDLAELKYYLIHADDEQEVCPLETAITQNGFIWGSTKK
ncbi:MAG: hypothetical protein H6Q70_2634 [Firmicutes bacterium]|nr:hypothetical protein [Bacillota bacterium]